MYRFLCAACLLAVANSASISIGEPHIIGGTPVKIEQFPYQVSMIKYGIHNCGASILGPKYIVTAAHCLAKGEKLATNRIRIGSTSNIVGGSVIGLYSFVRHPRYQTNYRFDFDVGVGILAKSIQFGPTAQPIALVPINKEPQAGEMVSASGWGFSSVDQKRSDMLLAVTIPIVSRGNCRRANQTKITENMICAGGSSGKSIYQGDSGGPLVNGKKELVGITSFASMKKPTEVAAGFTNIASPPIHQFITKHAPNSTMNENE